MKKYDRTISALVIILSFLTVNCTTKPKVGDGSQADSIPITNKLSSDMVSRRILKSDYKQRGGTCLLASYAFLLEYAGIFQSSKFIRSVYDVFAEYLKFHNTLEPIECLTAEQIKSQGIEAERMVGKNINSYCFAHGHIAGYQQIKNFHLWLKEKGIISNIDIITVMPPIGKPRSKPMADAYQTIEHFLKEESDQVYYGALILYLAGKGAHTVFLGYDGDFFIRDSNYSHETGNNASFDFKFSPNSPITEYMLFKINK